MAPIIGVSSNLVWFNGLGHTITHKDDNTDREQRGSDRGRPGGLGQHKSPVIGAAARLRRPPKWNAPGTRRLGVAVLELRRHSGGAARARDGRPWRRKGGDGVG